MVHILSVLSEGVLIANLQLFMSTYYLYKNDRLSLQYIDMRESMTVANVNYKRYGNYNFSMQSDWRMYTCALI